MRFAASCRLERSRNHGKQTSAQNGSTAVPDDDRGCRLSSQGSPGLYLGRYLQIFGEQVSGKYSSKSEQESVAQVKVAHKAQPR